MRKTLVFTTGEIDTKYVTVTFADFVSFILYYKTKKWDQNLVKFKGQSWEVLLCSKFLIKRGPVTCTIKVLQS
jgi:hypothetical protein